MVQPLIGLSPKRSVIQPEKGNNKGNNMHLSDNDKDMYCKNYCQDTCQLCYRVQSTTH